MTYYIETIGVEEGDRMPLAMYHLRRVSETLCGVPPFLSSEEQLRTLLRAARPDGVDAPLKMRIVYSSSGIADVTVTPYTYDIRRVRRLQLYRVPDSYRYDRKYLDRTLLDRIASSLPDHETVALLIRGIGSLIPPLQISVSGERGGGRPPTDRSSRGRAGARSWSRVRSHQSL